MKLTPAPLQHGDPISVVYRAQLMYTAVQGAPTPDGIAWKYDARTVIPAPYTEEGNTWVRGHHGVPHPVMQALRNCEALCSTRPPPRIPTLGAIVTAWHDGGPHHGHIVTLDDTTAGIALGAFADPTLREPLPYRLDECGSSWVLGMADLEVTAMCAATNLRT